MLNKLIDIFKQKQDAPDPLNGYKVGDDFKILIADPKKIEDWSICQVCLDVIENSTKKVPVEYWCCPDCASEAIEISYMSLPKYLEKHPAKEIKNWLEEWRQKDDLVDSYKLLKELRYIKLIELNNAYKSII